MAAGRTGCWGGAARGRLAEPACTARAGAGHPGRLQRITDALAHRPGVTTG